MEWFEQEFKDVPYYQRKAAKEQIEELVRKVIQTHSLNMRDPYKFKQAFTNGEISVRLYTIFDLVSRFKNARPDE